MESLKELKEIVRDSIKKRDGYHSRLLQSIDQRYSEENKGELLVATGAFALLINFLFNLKKPEWISLLLIGVTMLVLNIVLKFHILRLSADRAINELSIVKKKIAVSGTIYSLLFRYELKKEDSIAIEILEENQKMYDLDKELGDLPKKWSNSIILNEVEYYLFSIGLGLILIFFYVNLID